MVRRPDEAKGQLKLKVKFTALKSYIEYEVYGLNSKFQSVCDKLKSFKTQEYETVALLQQRIDFLQSEVASIRTLVEMQTNILD